MHVLVAAHDFYPDRGSGGTGRYVYETARRLVADGHDVSVLTRRRGDEPAREVVDGVRVRRYDLPVANRSGPAILAALPRAARTVADHVAALEHGRPTVLSPQGPITPVLAARALDGVPRVGTFHSPWPREYLLRTRGRRTWPRRRLNARLRYLIERRHLSRADHLVALSEFMQRRLQDTYDLDVPTSVVPGGVDAGRYAPATGPSDRIDGGDPAILTVRRLSERMGHDLLLAAVERLVGDHPDAHLYVAGDGPLRERLSRAAARRGLDGHVTFLGYVPDGDLPAVYADADLFALPTTDLEGFGLATLEALASATPVVGTPVGGTVEVLSGLDDAVALPADPLADAPTARALADGLDAWATVPAGERHRAGERCREHVRETYPWERTARRLADRYRAVTD